MWKHTWPFDKAVNKTNGPKDIDFQNTVNFLAKITVAEKSCKIKISVDTNTILKERYN